MPLDEIQIEPATDGDAVAVLDLQRRAYRSEAVLYDDWTIPPLTQTLDDLRLRFTDMTILKATEGGTIVGSVRAAEKDGVCAIGRLIVDPDHQRRGIGSRLMEAIEGRFPDALRFELFTGGKSEGNIRLYTRLGYRVSRTEVVSPKLSLVFFTKARQER